MKEDFLKYQGQTTPHPLGIEITSAKGSYIYDANNKKYLDFVAGVSANSVGHSNEAVNKAITEQLQAYTHVMVYGEFIQEPQLNLCKALVNSLPDSLNSVYLVNSGAEATEGALKLAKRFTNRYEIIAAKNAYHGNSAGAMSVCGSEEQNSAFRPLIPGTRFINFNNEKDLEKITTKTAGVILETIQGGAGFIEPKNDYLRKVKEKCDEVGALLILDEIQTGVGRTGTFWGFENYNVIPDIIITGKGLGGGMPIGAFIASYEVMDTLKENPKLGHITTFGGHPLISAAGLATINEINDRNLTKEALRKEQIIREQLASHRLVKEIRGKGLMLSLIMESSEIADTVVLEGFNQGLILFWLLYEKRAVRITPPLTISESELLEGCKILTNILNNIIDKAPL
ncbi:aspartate aminotransferase family protein [Tenacibaculum sp. M341]|uniref:aspartate aminotransferase family protein n=1 Tax=Tenacibaculum sp. M341 TaxID=2530339 RepID=UPI00104FFDAC|nr:aspartate aminotransferase family protein [Tenacibaculum sp. M341]TCI94882.1 aspartate aminotransferase family protein [Tenacibaculum sp. M341]